MSFVGFDSLSNADLDEISFREEEGSSWLSPLPIRSSLPKVQKFRPSLLPDNLRDYVMDVADRQQAPPDFAAVTAICGLAAVIGNRVRVRPKQLDDWEVVPNLWGAIIGRPSAMKSPMMGSALAPIFAMQDELRTEWESAARNAEIESTLTKLNESAARQQAQKALKGNDRAGAREILASLADSADTLPCPRLVVNNATVEKLGELLNENPRGLFLVRDELAGFLAHIEREEFQSERAFYLQAFDGEKPFTYDRIGRGTVHISHCTLSMVGGIQPSRIAPIVRGALSGASNDGFVQRLQMAVWPDDVYSWRYIDRSPDAGARSSYEATFRALYNLTLGTSDKPGILRFSPESQALFQDWFTGIQLEARSGALCSTLESHVLKMPKTVASLALIFELADGGRFEIDEPAMKRALAWAGYLRSHAARLYAAGETIGEEGAKMIVERRKHLPANFTPRDIQRKNWGGLGDRDVVGAAIDVLVQTNHCRELPPALGLAGGRPSVTYVWNPKLDRTEIRLRHHANS